MSISVDRTTIVQGAGTVKLGTDQFFEKGGITAQIETTHIEDIVSGYGLIDKTKADELVRVTFTPSGEITAALLSALYPYASTAIDASLAGAVDVVAEVHSFAGEKLSLANAFMTRMPSLRLGAQETPFGEAEITACVKNATARTVADSLYTLSTAAWSGTYDKTKKIKGSYTGVWNSITIIPAESWNIEFDLQIEPRRNDDHGTVDFGLTGLTVRATCMPTTQGESIIDQLRAQGSAAAAIGTSARQGFDLGITCDIAGGIDLTLNDAMFLDAPLQYAEQTHRNGEVTFEASRDLSAGYGAIFSIALST